VKRIIFSIFSDNVDTNHVSSSDYKLSQFKKYKDQLKAAQQAYANKCGADYVLHENDWTEYNDLQFEKILKLERLILLGILYILLIIVLYKKDPIFL